MQELRKTITITCNLCKGVYPFGVYHKCPKRKRK